MVKIQTIAKMLAMSLCAIMLSGCQSLVDYQESLYVRGPGATSQGPDYPWCPVLHDVYPEVGITLSYVRLPTTWRGGGCIGARTGLTAIFTGEPDHNIEMYMDYGPRNGAAVGYLLGGLSNHHIKTMYWPADSVVPVMESQPPISKDSEKYIYPPDKVLEDEDLTINGLAWRHRYAYTYQPYNDGNGALDYAYEVYVHRLASGQLIYVHGNYDPIVTADPVWIAARRKVLHDMAYFIHIEPIRGESNSLKP